MPVPVSAKQLAGQVQLQFVFAREELAKLDITEEQWEAITTIFYQPEAFIVNLIKASNASGILGGE